MTIQDWIEAHPYLDNIASFEQLVDEALDAVDVPVIAVPDPAAYASDLAASTPLLRGAARPDLTDVADSLRQLVEILSRVELPPDVKAALVEFRDLVRESEGHALAAVQWSVAGDSEEQEHSPVVRMLAWRVLRVALANAVAELAPVRDAAAWNRSECPTCGATASLAVLVQEEGGRRRRLACVCCNTTWSFKRVGCPYCENESSQTLSILELDDDADHRLDLCDLCRGYVKTYVGIGAEELFLADWTTLHLDVIAAERGYMRMGARLYEV